MLPEGDGVTYVKRHEQLTGQEVADKEMPGSVTQPLVKELRSEVLAEFEDPGISQEDTAVSWREEDLVAHRPAEPGGATAEPSGVTARKAGRPPGSKNKVSSTPLGIGLDSSDESEGEDTPVARRTRSRGKTEQAAVVSVETQGQGQDPNYGILLQF